MTRVVLDTNIVVSAVLRPGGLPEAVFNFAVNRIVQAYVSEPILTEYKDVLTRDRLAIGPDKASSAVARIREASHLIATPVAIDPAACPDDPSDLIFLACAESADADYLVTGNRRHYPLAWKRTLVVTAREFMEIMTNAPGSPVS